MDSDHFKLDMSALKPKFYRPELLAHPHIPKAAVGMNPRTFKGRKWWDEVRKPAYAKNNYCCWACGIYPGDLGPQETLEAHECYDIFYNIGILHLNEIVALCRPCHNFIHSGRLYQLYRRGSMDKAEAHRTMTSRMAILRLARLEPFYATLAVYYVVTKSIPLYVALMDVEDEGMAILAHRDIQVPRRLWMLVVKEEVYDAAGFKIIG